MASAAAVDPASCGVAGAGQQVILDGSNPGVARLRQIIGNQEPSDGWSMCWEEGVTPWDLGQPTPAVVKLVQSGTLPAGNALVPGCGAGYDVVALSSSDRFVIGLDFSDTAIEKAKQRSPAPTDGSSFFAFVAADFFTWEPPEPFHLIFDYLFFCALNPSSRQAWAKRMGELLHPDGELITLVYLVEDQETGPPFSTTVLDYEDVLNPLGFVVTSVEDNEVAVEPRKGMEKIARWKKIEKSE